MIVFMPASKLHCSARNFYTLSAVPSLINLGFMRSGEQTNAEMEDAVEAISEESWIACDFKACCK